MFYPRAFEVGKLQLVNLRARQKLGLVLVGSAGVDTMGVGYFKRRGPPSWQLVLRCLRTAAVANHSLSSDGSLSHLSLVSHSASSWLDGPDFLVILLG